MSHARPQRKSGFSAGTWVVLCAFLVGTAPIAHAQGQAQSALPSAEAIAKTAAALAAGAAAAPQPYYRYDTLFTNEKVNADGTSEAIINFALTVLKNEYVSVAKQKTISFSASSEKVEVLSAYTLKVDGRRIDVPKDNFQYNTNKGRDAGQPAFSDTTSLTIIFPEVAVNDSVVATYKITQFKPTFPGQYSSFGTFPRSDIFHHVQVDLDFPVSMHVQFANFGMQLKSDKEENGHRLIELAYDNDAIQNIRADNAGAVYNIGQDPAYAVSTFPSYQVIAEAYGQAAKPKVVVDDQVKKLAAEIVKGKTDPRDKAQALYGWVSKNITLAGDCIGTGSVVPHDLSFVIQNKTGDCKDHATLLQALLAAEKIDSTQALINATNIFHLPKVPLVDVVSHVINYIPSLDLFVDATSHLPFGVLPPTENGKPVLLVDGFKYSQITPPMTPDFTHEKVDMKAKIGDDGSVQGTVDISYQGYTGIFTHEELKDMSQAREKEFLEKLVHDSDFDGSATLKTGSFDPKTNTYAYGFTFHLNKFVKTDAPGGIYIYPLLVQPTIDIQVDSNHLASSNIKEFLCAGGTYEENYEYEFPQKITITGVPNNLEVTGDLQTYSSTYRKDGQKVFASRIFTDHTHGPTCTEAVAMSYKSAADKIMPDIKAQIVYK